jgi:glycosyltransferase involved in cell wall biosynthesis
MNRRDELLVFLDGCSDRTPSIVKAIKDSRIRVFESHVGIGRSAARNRLIEESRGEFLAIQDSDDISLPWRFLLSRSLLRKYDAVFGNGVIFGSRLRFLPFAPLYPFVIRPDIAPLILTYRNPFIHSAAIFRKSLLSSELRYEEVPAEEYLLWIKLALKNARMFRTRIPLVAYRLHSGQVSGAVTFASEVSGSAKIREAQDHLALKLIGGSMEFNEAFSREEAVHVLRQKVHESSRFLRFEETFLSAIRIVLGKFRNQSK